jgi:deoxyribose-phosphate aldolase
MSSTIREADLGTSKVTPLPARAAANTPVPQDHAIARNPGMRLDLGFLESVRSVNRSALERRVASLTKRRSIKADNQAAWLLRAVACMDLTTLNSNDTEERVRRLCAKAVNPFRRDIVEGLGIAGETIRRLHRFPARPRAAFDAPAGNRGLGPRRRRRDRRRHSARPGVRRQMAGTLQ